MTPLAPSHVPTTPAPFHPRSCLWVQPKRPDPFPVRGGKAPAPGNAAGRAPGSQAWEGAGELREKSHPARSEPGPCPAASVARLGPPFPGAGRPWVGNPARCGKRSQDRGCQATLIQPLTNFQHFPASAAELNQKMIKHRVHHEPVESIRPSVHHRDLLTALCKAMGPPKQHPRGPARDEPPFPAEICRGRI